MADTMELLTRRATLAPATADPESSTRASRRERTDSAATTPLLKNAAPRPPISI